MNDLRSERSDAGLIGWTAVIILLMAGLLRGAEPPLPAAYIKLKADAERLYELRSYSLARQEYEKTGGMELPATERNWVVFRLADTQWRAAASTQTADTTRLDEARRQLEVLVRDITRVDQRDRVWAEVEESLADFYWVRRNSQNWGQAWPLYQAALDWWAGTADIAAARARYLSMVWRMARPPEVEPYYYYGSRGNYVPLPILENALQIAETPNDKAHAHYLIAMTLRIQGGDVESRARVQEEFEGALKSGKSVEWYDDALYNYGEWMMSNGRIKLLKDGNIQQEPDYVKALELFRRLGSEFTKGETRYWDSAQQQIKNITEPQLSVSVGSLYLPGSEIQYYLNWRNIKKIDLALYPIEFNRDVQLSSQGDWLGSIKTAGLEKIKSWSRETKDEGDYKPGNETLALDTKLKTGAYLLEATADGKKARDIVLVSDAAVVVKASGNKALVFFCNALNSEPLGGAKVKMWQRWYDGQNWQVRENEKSADKDGIAVFDLARAADNNLELFVGAILKDRQAFSTANSYSDNHQNDSWRIYAFTDRPAYRPKETVQWKIIARRYDSAVYSTPADQTIVCRIDDPRGASIKEEKIKLNAFGSASGTLDLPETMPLGEYHVTFWDESKQHTIGNATLFRFEEYKLPEFKVTVQTPEENGQKKAFRLGDKVEVNVKADYYFGGAVANASVELVIYQNPFHHYWHPPRNYPWFYEDMDSSDQRWGRYYGGLGQIIKRETLKTDASGKASLVFDTPRNMGQDLQYRIEARVTDSSRREIIGTGNVRVTQQRYYVYAEPDHNLYHPQDKVRVEFKALDANDQPVQTGGTVKVSRDHWSEIWIDPTGKEIKGDELEKLRSSQLSFPPLPQPNQPGWTLKFRGYEHDDILERAIKTDTNGIAELSFTPERDGYYRIAWQSEDSQASPSRPARPITAETTVWVATAATKELGYRHGGVQIIVDKDTFKVGQKAGVMLVAPTNDRHVLFTIEGDDLYSWQLVHMDGTVKLIEIPVNESFVPNLFLSATLVQDRQIFTDQKQVVVPPVRNFLKVEIKPDRSLYQPREEGSYTISTRDDAGQPVSTEVAFGVVDESIFYVQQDYAGDPRQFFYGTKRAQMVQTQSTLNYKRYARLRKDEKDRLYDEEDLKGGERAESRDKDQYYLADSTLATSELAVSGFAAGKSPVMRRALNSPAPEALAVETKAKLGVNAVDFQQNPEPAVQVRSDFRSTILWQPHVVTGKDGQASIKIRYPDSVTGWKAMARAVSQANQFGAGEALTRTRMPLIVRLQAPRFFVVGDRVTLSAVINNNTDQALNVRVGLEATGVIEVSKVGNPGGSTVLVPANGEARVDWPAEIKKPGDVKLKVTARGGPNADAMEKAYVAYEHGIEKFVAKSGKARARDITVKFELPTERSSTSLTVQVTPSLAVTMLDSLPYLIHYPYGCTEQTMSRFLPAAVTANTLKKLGLQPEDVMSRVFGGIEPSHASSTHPQGKTDLAELDKIITASLTRLVDFQHADGGWGWWKEGESDRWMTAYVVWGLALARDAGPNVLNSAASNALQRGAAYLDKALVNEEEHPDMQAWILHALAIFNSGKKPVSKFQQTAFKNIWDRRESLNAYTRALLALSAHAFGKKDEAKILIQNLENGVKRDERPDNSILLTGSAAAGTNASETVMGTAHWGEDGIYWRWSDGGVEATAFALRALLVIDPGNKLIEPVTNWLIKNRRGAQWNSTRDTAIAVLALNEYLRSSGEIKNGVEYELLVNGSPIAKKKLSGADLFNAPSRFAISPEMIKNSNEVRIRRLSGDGAIYFAVESKFFSLEEPIAPVGNEIFVKRTYYKLVGRPTLLKGYVYDRQELKDGDSVNSGERVETVLTVESKNNYEYLLFEDLKPAGLEAVEIRSGESLVARELKSGAVNRKFDQPNGEKSVTGDAIRKASTTQSPNSPRAGVARRASIRPGPGSQAVSDSSDYTDRSRYVYQELRDRKVAMFVDKLPEGVWEIRYDLRAEVPGKFHALPVVGYAMYVPEIRCNGAEVRLSVDETKP